MKKKTSCSLLRCFSFSLFAAFGVLGKKINAASNVADKHNELFACVLFSRNIKFRSFIESFYKCMSSKSPSSMTRLNIIVLNCTTNGVMLGEKRLL